MGFDVIVFGLLPMIVWGAVHSAKEYEHHSLRTSLLIAGDKNILFFSKIGVFFFFSLAISFVSIYGTILITHLSLGKESIHPILLNATIWKYILLGVIAWTLLAMLAFLMGSLFRTAVVPLLFLIPQVYNVWNFLNERFSFGKFLPVSLGNGLIAASHEMLSSSPIENIFYLGIWIITIGLMSYVRFNRSDLGGKY